MAFVKSYGVTNKLSDEEYVYFADCDNVKLKSLTNALKKMNLTCIVLRSSPAHYHVISPQIISEYKVINLHQQLKKFVDNFYVYNWFKFGYNALRITRKAKNDKPLKLVATIGQLNNKSKYSLGHIEFFNLLFKAWPQYSTQVNLVKKPLNFITYKISKSGRGKGYANKLLTPQGLQKDFKDLLNKPYMMWSK